MKFLNKSLILFLLSTTAFLSGDQEIAFSPLPTCPVQEKTMTAIIEAIHDNNWEMLEGILLYTMPLCPHQEKFLKKVLQEKHERATVQEKSLAQERSSLNKIDFDKAAGRFSAALVAAIYIVFNVGIFIAETAETQPTKVNFLSLTRALNAVTLALTCGLAFDWIDYAINNAKKQKIKDHDDKISAHNNKLKNINLMIEIINNHPKNAVCTHQTTPTAQR